MVIDRYRSELAPAEVASRVAGSAAGNSRASSTRREGNLSPPRLQKGKAAARKGPAKTYRFATEGNGRERLSVPGFVTGRTKPRIAYIVSGLPKYRPARRTASIPIRPCLQDCACEPSNAPQRCSALSVCRPSPELAASRTASLETSGENDPISSDPRLIESLESLDSPSLDYIPTNFLSRVIAASVRSLSRVSSLTFLKLGPAIVGDPFIDIIDTRVGEYVADVLGTTPRVEVDQSVSRLFLSHLP